MGENGPVSQPPETTGDGEWAGLVAAAVGRGEGKVAVNFIRRPSRYPIQRAKVNVELPSRRISGAGSRRRERESSKSRWRGE